MNKNHHTVLCHYNTNFSGRQIKHVSKSLGLLSKDSLESHIWVYELYAQIQQRATKRCILKGGASAQLYLPMEWQRCTNDIDCVTDLSPKELNKIMLSIKDSLYKDGIHSSYREYIPKSVKLHGRTIPMMTFIFNLPFVFKTERRFRYPGLKIDFLFLDLNKLYIDKILNAQTLGLTLSYSPYTIDKYSTISDKLLTLACNSFGIESYKIDAIYKNIYDLYCLVNSYNNLECFKLISKRIEHSLSIEIEMKKGHPITVENLMNDILKTLYHTATLPLRKEYKGFSPTVLRFQEDALQKDVREMLNPDMWSIMAFFLFLWVYSLKMYILKGDYSSLNGLNIVLDEYEYYVSQGKKERRQLKRELRKQIKELETNTNTNFNLEDIGSPLVLIYLNYILTNIKSKQNSY